MAFLGLFVLTLVIAHFIVEARHNEPLKAGNDIVEQIKNNGVASYFSPQNLLQYFQVKNSTGQVLGFTADQFQLGSSVVGMRSDIRLKSILYIRGRYAQQQTVFFQSTNTMDMFKWSYKSAGIRGGKNIQVTLDETQILSILTLGRKPKEIKFRLKSNEIPEMFLDVVMQQMLSSGYNKIIIDTIQQNGQISPLLITKIEKAASASDGDYEYVLELKLLDSSGFTERVFMNQQGIVSKKILQQEQISLERTDINTILKQFPERAEYILRGSEILEQN